MRPRFSISDLIWSFRLDRLYKFHPLVERGAKGTIRKSKEYADKTYVLVKKGVAGVEEEARETKVMAESFFRVLESKLDLKHRKEPPSEEEVKAAIEQLKDVGRFSLFATVSILPGGGFTLIGLELLARKFGVTRFTLVPSSFRKKEEKKTDEAESN